MANLQQNNSNSNTNVMYSSGTTESQLLGCIEQSNIQLKQLTSAMELFSKDTALSFIKEELELTKLQKDLLQVKYDLLNHTYESLASDNLLMHNKLEAYTCSICLTNSKDCILEPCGHFVCCIHCIAMIPDSKCPVCRSVCNYYIKVFNS
jgi:rubrerythrin